MRPRSFTGRDTQTGNSVRPPTETAHQATLEHYRKLRRKSPPRKADFLFGPEIPTYIDDIVKRGWALRSAHNQYRDMFQPIPAGYDHEKVVSEMHEQETWFTNQIGTGAAKDKFRKYLDVSR